MEGPVDSASNSPSPASDTEPRKRAPSLLLLGQSALVVDLREPPPREREAQPSAISARLEHRRRNIKMWR